MHRVLLDTDVLLDALDASRPESDEACRVIDLCSGAHGNGILGMACVLSLKDVYCVLSRFRGESIAREGIRHLLGLLAVAPVGPEECVGAIDSNEPDYEDGLIRAVAELNGVDFIVTRDKRAFSKSKVRSVTASEYLEIVT